MSFLRVLLPSWRFFEDVGPKPELYVRLKNDSLTNSTWKKLNLSNPRKLTSLVFNPEGNLSLAYYSLLDRALLEISDLPDEFLQNFNLTVTYRLIRNLVETQIRNDLQKGSSTTFQFKIAVHEKSGESYDALVSEEHEVSREL